MRTALKWSVGALLIALLALLALSWLAPGVVYRGAMAWERRAAGLELGAVGVDGESWSLLQGGNKAAPTLLLLHGFGADKDNWVRIAGHLRARFHLIVPDLPGFGDSAPAAGADYSIEAQAARVGRLLDALGLEGVSVGGSSMGGYIALALARQRPDQIESLWLLAPGGIGAAPLSEMIEHIAGGGDNPLIPASPDEFERTLDFVFERRPFIPWPVRRYLGRRQAVARERYEAIFADLRYRSRPAEALAAGLLQPTLIVWGSEDRVLHPGGAELLAAVMPGASVRIMPGVGHLPMVEAPRQTASEYLAWRQKARLGEERRETR